MDRPVNTTSAGRTQRVKKTNLVLPLSHRNDVFSYINNECWHIPMNRSGDEL